MVKALYDKGIEPKTSVLEIIDKLEYYKFEDNLKSFINYFISLLFYIIITGIIIEFGNTSSIFLYTLYVVFFVLFTITIMYLIKSWDTSSFTYIKVPERKYIDLIDLDTLKIQRKYLK